MIFNSLSGYKKRNGGIIMAMTFTDANFEAEVLKSEVPVLVDFYADWCGPCKMMAPSIEQLATEYEGKVKIGKLDVDTNGVTAQHYRVMSIPTLLIFKGGEVVDTIVGAVPKNQVEAKINAAM
jgi:thioredoxin 1